MLIRKMNLPDLLGRLLLPDKRCPSCTSVFKRNSGDIFCPQCSVQLERREKAFCPICGELAAWPTLPVVICGKCLKEAPPWKALYFHGPYEGLLRQLVINLKFMNSPYLAAPLSSLMTRNPALADKQFDAIVPIPLHLKRLRHRGYNQSYLIALPLAKQLGVKFKPEYLQRTRHTTPQTGKGLEERKNNLAGAFSALPACKGKSILLVDDIFTTGSTFKEATARLMAAGAAVVYTAALCRTPRHFYSGKEQKTI